MHLRMTLRRFARLALAAAFFLAAAMVARGRVTGKRVDTDGDVPRYLVDFEIGVFNQRDELCCPAEVTVELIAT